MEITSLFLQNQARKWDFKIAQYSDRTRFSTVQDWINFCPTLGVCVAAEKLPLQTTASSTLIGSKTH